MQMVQAGIPLSFEVTFDQPDLFVAMEVWDVTGGSPSLVDTLPMSNLSGNTYYCNFTPAVDKRYVTNKAVYTDDTYTARDGVHPEGSDSFSAIDLPLVLAALGQGSPITGIVEVETEIA